MWGPNVLKAGYRRDDFWLVTQSVMEPRLLGRAVLRVS